VRGNKNEYSEMIKQADLGVVSKTDYELILLHKTIKSDLAKIVIENEQDVRKRINTISDSLLVSTIPTLLGTTLGFLLGLISQNLFT